MLSPFAILITTLQLVLTSQHTKIDLSFSTLSIIELKTLSTQLKDMKLQSCSGKLLKFSKSSKRLAGRIFTILIIYGASNLNVSKYIVLRTHVLKQDQTVVGGSSFTG